MLWIIIIIVLLVLFTFGFCKGLGHYRTEEQQKIDDEAQIKFLEEWQDEKQKSRQ